MELTLLASGRSSRNAPPIHQSLVGSDPPEEIRLGLQIVSIPCPLG